MKATKVIKKFLRKVGIEISNYNPIFSMECISLDPDNGYKGSVLLSLWVEPFLSEVGEPVSNAHSHSWTSLQIAKTFLESGYHVDVVDYRNKSFVPEKDYAFFVAFRTNFERISKLLNNDCIKIVYLDTAHWLFNNHETFKRGLALQERKGITLTGLRIIETNMAIEYADYAIITANRFTLRTYEYAKKPLFRLPFPTCSTYPWPEAKNHASCRKNFLWFGSAGFVHKGLDLVLDAFAELPDCHLYVCGPIQSERDFEEAYRKELYQTPNIHTPGWVDVEGTEFIEITNKCIALIYPSCSEGGGGSAITCMQAGLIPVVSYEASVDVEDFGIILKESSIETIRQAIQMISTMPAEQLRIMSRKAWEHTRLHHTRERFAEGFRRVVDQVTTDRQPGK